MSQVIVNKSGPLPITSPISWPSDRTVLLSVTGSAFTKQPGTSLAVQVNVHATNVGMLRLMANQAGTHMALPAGFYALDGIIGETSITLSAANGTTLTDANDIFTIALIY